MPKKYSEYIDMSIAADPAVAYVSTPPRYAKLNIILGGKLALEQPITSEMDLITLSRHGLPRRTLDVLADRLGISMERLSKLLHISLRTIQRKAATDHLSVHVSEQILAIAEVIRRGYEVFHGQEALEDWLHSELPSLSYRKPIDLMDTSFGTQMLLKILGRIEHGVF